MRGLKREVVPPCAGGTTIRSFNSSNQTDQISAYGNSNISMEPMSCLLTPLQFLTL